MAVGGRSEYHMAGPDGERSCGYWTFEAVEAGRLIEVVDGFARADGSADDTMPTTRMRVAFESSATGARFTSVTTFADVATMEQLAEMGMVEGVMAAFGQMDIVVADLTSFALDRTSDLQILDDLRFRVSRIIRGTVEQVWRAHHDASLVQRWLLGPDGWTMPVCEVATEVGDTYRWEWEAEDGSARFGFEGELVESVPPHRAVTTERPIGSDQPGTLNEMTLHAVEGGTLLTVVTTCPSIEVRDMILGTGMIDGVEASYARMESVLAA
jgi:uncharacterized protein YndB with AHSA1/START domain